MSKNSWCVFLSLLTLAIPGVVWGQTLVSCRDSGSQAHLLTPQAAREQLLSPAAASELRRGVVAATSVLARFQQDRTAEIRQSLAFLSTQNSNSQNFIDQMGRRSSQLRVRLSLAVLPALTQEQIYLDPVNMVNDELDLTYFRPLAGRGNLQSLTPSEKAQATQRLTDFLEMEIQIFTGLLRNQLTGLDRSHPHQRLYQELLQTTQLRQRLGITNRSFRAYLHEKLREFRNQQKELALIDLLHLPPLAYTVQSPSLNQQQFLNAIDQLIANGDREVDRLFGDLNFWLDQGRHNRFLANLANRHGRHKMVTLANGLNHLEPIFNYIPAVEIAVQEDPSLCPIFETALVIHFNTLSQRERRNLVLMVGALALTPFISGPVLITGAAAAGFGFSLYSIHQDQRDYKRLIEENLVELENTQVSGELLDQLQNLESNIAINQLLLPTMVPPLGLGARLLQRNLF